MELTQESQSALAVVLEQGRAPLFEEDAIDEVVQAGPSGIPRLDPERNLNARV